eukprot:1124-Heterococcus_DN1.PRE.1
MVPLRHMYTATAIATAATCCTHAAGPQPHTQLQTHAAVLRRCCSRRAPLCCIYRPGKRVTSTVNPAARIQSLIGHSSLHHKHKRSLYKPSPACATSSSGLSSIPASSLCMQYALCCAAIQHTHESVSAIRPISHID